ncbi:MAG: hypothetical protein FJW83_08360 [Actinobacteria bacterium]|nr:hypothetical protein [Actinomycetota bacterium]
MQLDTITSTDLLARADHGILATRHEDRGVDAVPVCFTLTAPGLVIPVDVVKPKRSTDLGRTRNLGLDPRAVLLVEGWDHADWSRLWWVRTHLRQVHLDDETRETAANRLRAAYPPYRDADFADLLGFEIIATTGWAASAAAVATGRSSPRRP